MFDDLKPHIRDLRKCLMKIAIALVIAFGVAFYFWEVILNWMVTPLISTLPHGKDDIIFTEVGETFFTALRVSFFASFILALPVIFWQVWVFIAPGLYDNEKRFVIPFVLFATLFFISGCAFAYYIAFPIGFAYLIGFGSQEYTALPKIADYVGFFTKLMVGFGISFELPVVTFFLAKIGLVSDKTLKDYFKYAIVFIFVLAAILTPPDILSQFLMAIPLVLLYGLSILIARLINPHKEMDEE
ncbi:MAG: twin-arginine translocase subunit TatC [Helicobacter sp.]|nr:twin-arginine translocase subunit TatC [Helicobacter sp.]